MKLIRPGPIRKIINLKPIRKKKKLRSRKKEWWPSLERYTITPETPAIVTSSPPLTQETIPEFEFLKDRSLDDSNIDKVSENVQAYWKFLQDPR